MAGDGCEGEGEGNGGGDASTVTGLWTVTSSSWERLSRLVVVSSFDAWVACSAWAKKMVAVISTEAATTSRRISAAL